MMNIMRHHPIKRLTVLGALICVTSIGVGCTQTSTLDLPGNSGSNTATTPVASTVNQNFPVLDSAVDKQQARSLPSQSTSSDEWLLQPGLLGVLHGMWLGWISFAVGLFGIGLAVAVKVRFVNPLTQKLDAQNRELLKRIRDLKDGQIHQLSEQNCEYSAQLNRLQINYQQLKNQQSAILAAINGLRAQQKPEPQSYATPAPRSISTPLVASQPFPPCPAQKQAELTAAVNRGDRQVVKSETRAQLNITHASENAISMGRLNETQLEEVSAGGSYWAASFAGETWLYPTEQTLKGYSQTQRPTGIFNYTRQPIPSALVLSPARLTLSGNLWQVVEMGSIAVPG